MFRVIDANLNRCNEGLRVIEDLLRFHYETKLFEEIKKVRHNLKEIEKSLPKKNLVKERNSVSDLGNKVFNEEMNRSSIKDLLTANFKRIQESFRVLEEVLKLSFADLSEMAKNNRFIIYTIEKKVWETLDKDFSLKLYLVTDSRQNQKPLEKVVEESILGGVTFVQLREKHLFDKDIIQLGKKVLNITQKYKIPLVIDDRVDLCLAIDADGVHLGQNDLSIKKARYLLGNDKIIGKSTHSINQVKEAVKQPIDYFAFGPIYATPTKDYKPVGLKLIDEVLNISKESNIPVVFIGGITLETIDEVVKNRINNIALVREIMGSQNPKEKASLLIKKLDEGKTK